MTIANEDARTGPYSGNDSTTVFAYDFTALDEAHLVITLTDSASIETVLTLTTHYTVSGVGVEGGGNITMVTAPATGEKLTVTRSVPLTQLVDLQNRGATQPATLEAAYDKAMQIAQDLQEQINRSVKVDVSSGDDPDALLDSITVAVASTAADVVTTNANVVLTAADVVLTAADVVSTASYAAQAQAAAFGWATITDITAVSTDIELADTRSYYKIDASSNAVSMNLPLIGTDEGMMFRFEVVDATNTITIVRDGTDYVNGVDGNYVLTTVGTIIDFVSDDNTPDNWLAGFATNISADDVTLAQVGTTFEVKDDGVTPAKVQGSINAQTGTSYTSVLGDAYKTITMSNASANTFTIPLNASVAYVVGDYYNVFNIGAGECTLSGDTGVTLNGVSAGSIAIAQYSSVTVQKIATDTWVLAGGTVA